MCWFKRYLVFVFIALLATGCARDKDALGEMARVAIMEKFDAQNAGLIDVKSVVNINRSAKPPQSHKIETGKAWDYFAVSAKVLFKEPTYRVIRSRRIDPVNNRYMLFVEEVTPANYEGIITGKIRLLKNGDYVSGFYPDGLIGDLQNGYGKFLGSFDPTGAHRIRIINSRTDSRAQVQGTSRERAGYRHELRALKSEIDDNLGEDVIVGEF